MRLKVDIDGVLCNNTGGQRHKAEPNEATIQTLNQWYINGATIILESARPWAEYDMTKEQLARWGVRYDTLILGKPQVDFTIDDRSVQTVQQLELQMHFAKEGKYNPA